MEAARRSRGWAGAAALAPWMALVIAACSTTDVEPPAPLPANVSCAESDLGCRCASSPITPSADETAVPSCDDKLGRTCCYDVNASMQTTECECETATCTGNTHNCECQWHSGAANPTATTDLAACTPAGYAGTAFASPGVCCVYNANDGTTGAKHRTCRCDESKPTCDNGYSVTSCAQAERDCTNFGTDGLAGQGPADTCGAVTWQPQ